MLDEQCRSAIGGQVRHGHGRALIAAGTRPIDNPTYRQRDDQIQALRRRLPAASPIR
jgi:hypothetical protein